MIESSVDECGIGKPDEACGNRSELPGVSFETTDGMAGCPQFTADAERALSSFWRLIEFALYSVSTPSGIITIKDVPTKTPIPIDEMSLSCEGDRVNASGNEPTTKDLQPREGGCQLAENSRSADERGRRSRLT